MKNTNSALFWLIERVLGQFGQTAHAQLVSDIARPQTLMPQQGFELDRQGM